MKKILVLVTVMSIALALGCGKEAEEEVAEKRVEQETGSDEHVQVSGEPAGPKVEGYEPGTDAGEKTRRSKQEKNVKAKGKPIDVSDDSFEREVLESDIAVLVDFWAPWCRPCLISAPVLESIAEEYKEELKVCKLNVDQERRTAWKYSIRSIPTLIFYKDGQVVDRVIGVGPNYEAELKRKIESHL
jgi:thioredoxin 1